MNNYHTVYADLPTSISAYCIRDKVTDFITIVLNSRMDFESLKTAYVHELKHIENGHLEQEGSADDIERGMT